MSLQPTPVWLIALPLLAAFLTALWARWRVLMPILVGSNVALFGLAASFYPRIAEGPLLETIVIAPPLGIHLHLDAASLLLVTLFHFAAAMVGAFIWLGSDLDRRRVTVLVLLMVAGCNGMVLTGDLFNFYVFFELTGVAAYSLSVLRRDRAGLAAGLRYLIIGSVAAIFLLFGIVLVYLHTGTLNLAAIGVAFAAIPTGVQILIGLLMLVGLGIKAELFPLNFWVPEIYSGSDPVVVSLFSGVVVKAFLFALFHIVFLLVADPAVVSGWLMVLGATTMLVAEWIALRQQDIRRMLAYSSLGQVGLVAMAFASGSEAVTAAAMFHLVNHTLGKLLLFLLAAFMIRRSGSPRLDSMAGLASVLPLATGLFVLGSIAIIGLPPTSGFVSKFWLLKGFVESGLIWPVALILLGGLLEAAYYFRWIRTLYASGQQPAPTAGPRLLPAYAPLMIVAGLILAFGIAPKPLEPHFIDAAHAMLDRDLVIDQVLGIAQ